MDIEEIQKQTKAALFQIIRCIQSREPIEENCMNQYIENTSTHLSSKVNLLSILYNATTQDTNLTQFSDIENKIYLKGNLIKQFAKLLHLPKPACFLSEFDYISFEDYCQTQKINHLSRHSKGIFPSFYVEEHRPFQFLPTFYLIQDSKVNKENGVSLVGNRCWETSRVVVKEWYDKKIKQQWICDWQPDWNSKKNGIRLSYIFLLGLKDQLEQFISKIQNNLIHYKKPGDRETTLQNKQEYIAVLEMWFRNYQSFIDEGIKIYIDQPIDSIDIFYPENNNVLTQNFQLYIIQTIRHLVNSKLYPTSQNIQVILEYIGHCFLKQAEKYDIYLMVAFCQAIAGQNDQMNKDSLALKFYKQRMKDQYNDEESEEYFDRIFLSEEEILEKYESGKLRTVPELLYGEKMMQKIYEYCFKFNSETYLKDQEFLQNIFNKLSLSTRIQLLTQSSVLGRTQKNLQTDEFLGNKILQLTEEVCKLQDKSLQNRFGYNFKKRLQKFKKSWQQYYHNLKNDQSIKQLTLLFESMKSQIQSKKQEQAEIANKIGQYEQNISKLKRDLQSPQPVERKQEQFEEKIEKQSSPPPKNSKIQIQAQLYEIINERERFLSRIQFRHNFIYPHNSKNAVENVLVTYIKESFKDIRQLNHNFQYQITRKLYEDKFQANLSFLVDNPYFKQLLKNKELVSPQLKSNILSSIIQQTLIVKKHSETLSAAVATFGRGDMNNPSMDAEEPDIGQAL